MQLGRINRWRAAPIHFAISVLIALLVFSVVFFLWYPGALFGSAGGRDLFLLIACVDVTIGPLITLIVFVPGKKGLKFDLVVIAVCQLAALSYGTYVLFESRPVWLVFAVDRFEIVRANQIIDAERAKAKPPFDALSMTGPPIVGVKKPTNPDEQLRIGLTALAGQDLQTYPQYLVPYDDVRKQVIAKAKPFDELWALNPDERGRVDRIPAELGLPPARLGIVPMRAGKKDLTVVIDRTNGDFLGTYDLRPWQY